MLDGHDRQLTPSLSGRGRVEMWRGGGRLGISVSAPFVWRCLTGAALAPFPHPAHRTGRADFPHPALGQGFTPCPRLAAPARGQAYQAKMAIQVREWIAPAPSSPDLVLETQPPEQPHRGVVVESAIRPRDRADIKVVGPATQRTVQLVHQPCGVLPCPPLDGQRVDRLDHVPNALLRWP